MALFAAHYAGSIPYYAQILRAGDIIFDAHEHFRKQTYRNRIEILGPNGLQKLVIPTEKTGQRRPMQEVRISYAETWQKDHWKSLEAAYRRSPYFEYYEHRFRPFYTNRIEHLLDFNLQMHTVIMELLNRSPAYSLTNEYPESATVTNDFRDVFDPASRPDGNTVPYLQVFSDRHPFIPHLSVLDALFNLGPKTADLVFL